jgi:hypothetical protein
MAKPRNTVLTSALLVSMAVFYGPALLAQTPPTIFDIANAPIPIQVLVQSPADTETDMQVICLFRSSAVNTMHGSFSLMPTMCGKPTSGWAFGWACSEVAANPDVLESGIHAKSLKGWGPPGPEAGRFP